MKSMFKISMRFGKNM
uniref:Uncharacterized protein n=1 Tax=Anguilla anguilla TaxID=7936 RepID=A0A0E9RU34_ANGAN